MRMGVGLHALKRCTFSSVTTTIISDFCYSLPYHFIYTGHQDVMRTFRGLFRLPQLLPLFSFVIAAPVEVEVELLQLAPDNFKSSIVNGVW